MEHDQTMQGQEAFAEAPVSAKHDIEAVRRQHLMDILLTAEEARNPSNYEDYCYHPSSGDPHIQLFCARRTGRGHIRHNKPCQDYCMTDELGSYIILADADGVSSCIYSETGSQLACQAAVALIKEVITACNFHEPDVVSNLKSLRFRERLVLKWVDLVKQRIAEDPDVSEDIVSEIQNYGSTLIFAVITPNWYVTGNLGDGQVMVFNDQMGIKLRNVIKESPAVRCLVHTTCAREDLIVEAFPRSLFNGILLSTDGMYDVLQPGLHFYLYARQIRARFTQYTDPPEPLQPFCYMESGEPLKDLSQIRTMDDCSIVLALDDTPVEPYIQEVYRYLAKSTDSMMPVRWFSSCSIYHAYNKGYNYQIVVSDREQPVIPDSLKAAIVENPPELRICQVGSDDAAVRTTFAFYPLKKDDHPTLEDLFLTRMLQLRTPVGEHDINIISLYQKYSALKKELHAIGCMLNDAAHFLITFDGENLHIKKDAVTALQEDAAPSTADMYFSAFLGALYCGEKAVPLFDTGFVADGNPIRRMDEQSTEKLCCVRSTDKEKKKPYLLKNISQTEWTLSDGSTVLNGESTELTSGLTFCVGLEYSADTEVYRFVPKEEL